MTELRTPRLILRRWREEDVAALAAINADAEVMRWIGDGSLRSLEQTRAFVDRVEREWDTAGLSIFAVQLRAGGELAGLTGMAVPHFLPEIMPAVEIAWRLARSCWGRGIATEAARSALDFGLTTGQLARIVAVVQVGNLASERVTHKLGMRLERQTTDPGSGRPVRVYESTAAGR